MARARRDDHIKSGNGDGGSIICWCEHCGGHEKAPLPMPVSGRGGFVSWSRRFIKAHVGCSRPERLYGPPEEVIRADERSKQLRERSGQDATTNEE